MTVEDQPPVPPLGEAAVSRVERGVFAALDRDAAERAADWGPVSRPRWRGRAVVVSASVLAALAVLGVRQFWRAPGLPAHGARVATATSPSHVTVEGAASTWRRRRRSPSPTSVTARRWSGSSAAR